jgi:YjbR
MSSPRAGDERLRRLARASSLALDAGEYADVQPDVEARVRAGCLALPEAVERQAWAGAQWRVRNRAFAHVLAVDFADGPVTVMTFRASAADHDALLSAGPPFFRPAWGRDAVGMVVDDGTDWDQLAELVVDSYRTVAPRKLIALIDASRPPGA